MRPCSFVTLHLILQMLPCYLVTCYPATLLLCYPSFSTLIQAKHFHRGILGQESQGRLQHAPLLGRVVWLADGGPASQFGKRAPGWGGQAGDPGIPGSQGSRNPFDFQRTRSQSHGLGTERSSGHQQSGVHLLGFGGLDDGRNQLIDRSFDIREPAAEADE